MSSLPCWRGRAGVGAVWQRWVVVLLSPPREGEEKEGGSLDR